MSLFSVFDIAGSAMGAQSVRLNTTASNLANAESVSGSEAEAYRARHPVFTTFQDAMDESVASVRVSGIVENQAPPRQEYSPDHPLADDKGYVYLPNVNMVEEMANMISASRSYQNNVQMINTSKKMLLNVLQLGK